MIVLVCMVGCMLRVGNGKYRVLELVVLGEIILEIIRVIIIVMSMVIMVMVIMVMVIMVGSVGDCGWN